VIPAMEKGQRIGYQEKGQRIGCEGIGSKTTCLVVISLYKDEVCTNRE